MKQMTFEDFLNYYHKYGKCPNDISKNKNELNDIQLVARYEKYIKSTKKQEEAKKRHIEKVQVHNNKIIEIDYKWKEVVEQVKLRDNNICRLIKILNLNELQYLKDHTYPFYKTLDPAHIISRAQAPDLVYDIENIILLNRASHSFIDTYKNPITGKSITKQEQLEWWYRIVGKEFYENLLKKSKY